MSRYKSYRGVAAAALSAVVVSVTLATSSASAATKAVTIKGGPGGKTTYSVKPNKSLMAGVPSSELSNGMLQIATDPSTPPYEFQQSGVLRGSDIDLGNAIAAELGVKDHWNTTQFAGIITAMQAGRYSFALSAMGDTPQREQAVDFVDYSVDSNAIVVPKGNPLHIKNLAGLCGLKVADLQGSVFAGLITQQNAKCAKKMQITTFPEINSVLLQLETGRAQATMYQTGVAEYIIKTAPSAEKHLQVLTGTVYGEGYNAIPFNKSDKQLRNAVQKAIVALQKSGVYKKILDAWGMNANGISKITINDGIRFNQPS